MNSEQNNGKDQCSTCKSGVWGYESDGDLIPVWEDPNDYNTGEGPDYIGCTECHTMREVGCDA
jgi:hypothetical protein